MRSFDGKNGSIALKSDQPGFIGVLHEKLEALRTAILNSAIGMMSDQTERAIFLDLINTLTPARLSSP